jgi:nucleotide-binding universal stress UspA family protein
MIERILVPTDGSARSDRAVKAAASLAAASKGSLTIFHVAPRYRLPPYTEGYPVDWPTETSFLKETAETTTKMLARAQKIAAARKVVAKVAQARSDSASDAIVAAARREHATMIVMASHGRRGLEKLLLGSETQKVLARTRLPVLVIR